MADHPDQINQLLGKLESLLKRQEEFSREIDSLRTEINRLKATDLGLKGALEEDGSATLPGQANVRDKATAGSLPEIRGRKAKKRKTVSLPKISIDLEKFIGENLVSKIGIAITVMGVAIGAKYTIDHDLISPVIRIVLGYLTGLALLGIGLKLKKRYENYSAVLVSGAMAILYFITYTAYTFYELFPQITAFGLMVIFTVFTVFAALLYNKQVIALIGLVGAYAVPFLVSESSGEMAVLFSYMAIINAGILVIAVKKYWKPLYYASFGLTWLMYIIWFTWEYRTVEHFGPALTFLTVFFAIFYSVFLAYKLLQKEQFGKADIMLLLTNSFIFYGIGYAILMDHQTGKHFLGLFTICNAILHALVSMVVYRQKIEDRNLFYLLSGLALVFITIAIPVQLDGRWVTLLWAGEAALLFWIGRTKNAPVYEMLSYPLMLTAFFSIVNDWSTVYDQYDLKNPEARITPLLNVNFLTSMLFTGEFAFINHLFHNKKYPAVLTSREGISNIVSFSIPAILVFSLYYAFQIEIATYWNQLSLDSTLNNVAEGNYPGYFRDYDLSRFKTIWIINYSLLFVSLLAFINIAKIRNQQLGLINLGLIVLAIAAFLIQGLYDLSELRGSYLAQTLAEYYHRGIFNLLFRYVSYIFVALALYAGFRYIRQDFIKPDLKIVFDLLLHVTALWILSSELIHWMDIAGAGQSYKIGLSILWGVYSLFLIAMGIWKKKKHLRIGAILLFGLTLTKLFFYDISHLDTIAKTIVFVSLGVLLLIISFLYNKYRHLIS